MADVPEELLRRSAEARAAADGVSVEEILARWRGEAPAAAEAPAQEPAAPAATDVTPAPAATGATLSVAEYAQAASEASGMPVKLLMRSAEAKAKAEGTSVEAVLAGMAGMAAPGAAAAPAAPAAAAQAAAMSTEQLSKAAAEASGMPEKLLMRSAQAKAKAQGVPVESILAEMAGLPDPGSAAALAPTGTNGTTAVAPAPAPVAAPAGPPEGVRTQRLLTVVQAEAIQQVKTEPTDKVNVWPHLVAVEFVALLAVTAVLIVISVIINAPLLEAANFNLTPNPSKAPWYFLGLQELLSYFDPMVAGVLIPGVIGLVGLMAIPYIDRNPSIRPADRKLAIMMFTFFLMGAATLVIFGSFFRGPGFNFTYPWSDGVFFDDLKDWLE